MRPFGLNWLSSGKAACGAALTVLAAWLVAAAPAAADSASISVADAGGGRMQANFNVTSTTCSSSGYCGWFPVALERHSTLGCVFDDAFLVWVGTLQDTTGSQQQTVTFTPFFPRRMKLCVFIEGGGTGPRYAGELTFDLPAGYGRQRSSGYNCSHFSYQRRAQYYLLLYPDDPSNLDADNDGAACEANSCPCGAEPIPAEPSSSTLGQAPPPSLVKLKRFKLIYYSCLKDIALDLDLSYNGGAKWRLEFFRTRNGEPIAHRAGNSGPGGLYKSWNKPTPLRIGRTYFAQVTIQSLGQVQESNLQRVRIRHC